MASNTQSARQWKLHSQQVESDKHDLEEGNLPRYLYRYTSLEWLEKNIINNNIYFADPPKLNDPFDCNLNIDATVTPEIIFSWLQRLQQQGVMNSHFQSILLNPKNQSTIKKVVQSDPNKLESLAKESVKNELDKLGICCFIKPPENETDEKNNLLMWAHYADKHKGVRLKFNTCDIIEVITPLQKVKYQNDYPEFDFYKGDEQFIILASTKSTSWRYENEYRSIQREYGSLSFPPKALIEITFGCRVPYNDAIMLKKQLLASGFTNTEYAITHPYKKEFKLEYHKLI